MAWYHTNKCSCPVGNCDCHEETTIRLPFENDLDSLERIYNSLKKDHKMIIEKISKKEEFLIKEERRIRQLKPNVLQKLIEDLKVNKAILGKEVKDLTKSYNSVVKALVFLLKRKSLSGDELAILLECYEEVDDEDLYVTFKENLKKK